MRVDEDPYEVLELDQGASEAEIRAAYRRLLRIYHPDRHASEPPDVQAYAADKMAKVNAALSILTDPRARGSYERVRAARERARGSGGPTQPRTPPRRTPSTDRAPTGDPDFDYRRVAASEFTTTQREEAWTARDAPDDRLLTRFWNWIMEK